jgi:hypothetical protein
MHAEHRHPAAVVVPRGTRTSVSPPGSRRYRRVGGGFEAVIDARVLDGNGQLLAETSITGSNLTSAWQTSVSSPDPPLTTPGS